MEERIGDVCIAKHTYITQQILILPGGSLGEAGNVDAVKHVRIQVS